MFATKTAAETRNRRWWTLVVLCLSVFLVVVDNTIVNTALPTLADDLHAGTSQLQWIVDAYTLAVAGLLLIGGALGDRYGRHRLLAGGLAVLGIGAGLAALSTNATELIATRALMGVGAAAVMPATLSILTDVFDNPSERVKAIGIWSGISGLGVAVGPTLSGWLLEHFDWTSVFLVHVPIVIVALIAGRALVPASRADRAPRLDPVGAILSLAGLVALTYGLIEAPERGWTSVATLGILGGAVALLAGFAVWELRREDPMVPLRVFRNSRFTAASVSVTLVFFSLFGALFLLTQILQFVRGYTPLEAGASALPFAFAVGITSPVAAILSKQRGSAKIPVAAGLALMAAGLAIMADSTAASGWWHYVFATVLMGAGMGFAMAPATDSIMGTLPPAQAGVGSAVNDTTREIGGVLGVAVMGSVASSVYAHHIDTAVSSLPHGAGDTARSSLGGALTIAHHIGGPTGSHIADTAREAFIAGASKGLLVAIAAAALGALLALRYLPARNTEPERTNESEIPLTAAAAV
ncbi:MAG TPA: MFS transporter [Solirubrobacteraceae bacterium]|nr:MFS transporter [Solirubrobacteraceae bacterium]